MTHSLRPGWFRRPVHPTFFLATGTPTEVGTLDSAAGPFGATGGRMRVESTLAVTGTSALSTLTLSGPGTARRAGPVTVSNLVVVSEGATLELGSTLHRTAAGRVAGGPEATRLTGTFDAVILPSLPSGRRLAVRYTPTSAVVRVLP